MKLSDISSRPSDLGGVLPPLRGIQRGVDRIIARWGDADKSPDEKDRDRLVEEMRLRLDTWNWSDLTMMRAVQGAEAAFDADRRYLPNLEKLRNFYVAELRSSTSTTLVTRFFRIYLETFDPLAPHTISLAAALRDNIKTLGGQVRGLIAKIPDLLNPNAASGAVARRMAAMDAPYAGLKALGFRSPHGPGLTQSAHRAYLAVIAPKLTDRAVVDKLFGWLCPDRGTPLQSGPARLAVEAMLLPWVDRAPEEDLRSHLTETIIAAYGDPRMNKGGIWVGFDETLKNVMLRWLTQEDMLFFCNVVTATQYSHMWPPRRDFWLGLFRQGRIDTAWVAFGSDAREYARKNLLRSGATNVHTRFGRQTARGGSTSLLIMKIGNRIVVDGCHSYKTHIFLPDEQRAPKLYQSQYDAAYIMNSARRSKSHSSIPSWKAWVEQNI